MTKVIRTVQGMRRCRTAQVPHRFSGGGRTLTIRSLVRIVPAVLATSFFLCGSRAYADDPQLVPGLWRAWLDSPGGELPFGLELTRSDDGWSGVVINGTERLETPAISWDGDVLVIAFEHYDSAVRARVSEDGRRLDGEWKKRQGIDEWSQLPFHATAGDKVRFKPLPTAKSSRLPR